MTELFFRPDIRPASSLRASRRLSSWLHLLQFLSLIAVPMVAATPTARAPETLVRLDKNAQARVQVTLGPLWRVLDTDHFRVFSDTSLRYHRLIAGVLEQFYQEAHPRFFTRPMAKLDVYLVDGGKDYEAFVSGRGLRRYADTFGW
jgi:hypothetical protein